MNYLFLHSISINFGLVPINHPQSPSKDLSYGWLRVRLAILIDGVRVFDYKSILFVILIILTNVWELKLFLEILFLVNLEHYLLC